VRLARKIHKCEGDELDRSLCVCAPEERERERETKAKPTPYSVGHTLPSLYKDPPYNPPHAKKVKAPCPGICVFFPADAPPSPLV
jgi:hypothetical protein